MMRLESDFFRERWGDRKMVFLVGKNGKHHFNLFAPVFVLDYSFSF
jgi:hypothetical protein